MVKKDLTKRYAFTLIELIFAIVVISIAVISLPTMTQTSSRSIENSFAQEAIFAASQELNTVLAYRWDESASVDENSSANVLDINGDCNAATFLRPGHIAQEKHRKCVNNLALVVNDGLVNNIVNFDLNDVNHSSQSIFLVNSVSEHGYKQNYNSTVSVTRLAAPNTGVKMVNVRITLPDNTHVTTLSGLSCNIGEIDYFHRVY